MTARLTVGMAVYEDFDACWNTLQSVGLHHRALSSQIELLIVDNAPHTEQGKMLADTVGWHQGKGIFAAAHYVPFTARTGTAAPRDLVFRLATAPVVLCADSHVLFPVGAFEALLSWFDRHPDSKDLLSGPLLYNDQRPHATHFTTEWEAGMWGRWANAWTCKCGHRIFGTQRGLTGLVAYHDAAEPQQQPVDCPKCGIRFPVVQWEGHEHHLAQAGCRPRGWDPAESAFEIGAHGLGIFAMRREAWPGFNPDFKGFGGEEWYLHTKVRQAGGKCYCLPALQWLHKFGRAGGIKYPLDSFDKARNYYLGHKELGLDVAPVYRHFVEGLNSNGTPAREDKQPGGLITAEHWKMIENGVDPRERPAQAASAFPVVQTKASCPSCAGAKMDSLEAWYAKAKDTPGDINEHVPTLRELASGCDTVVEFTARQDVATVGLLAGQPKKFISVTAKPMPDSEHLHRLRGETEFVALVGEAGKVTLPPLERIDLLFIDLIPHTADVLWAALSACGDKARRIVLHDTIVFGEQSDTGGPGLLPAVRRWVQENPAWSVIKHHRNNNGLMILSSEAKDKKKLPPKWKQALNVLKASARERTNVTKEELGPLAGTSVQDARLSLCLVCESLNDGKCAECGCPVDKKSSYPGSFCDLGNWHAETASEAEKAA